MASISTTHAASAAPGHQPGDVRQIAGDGLAAHHALGCRHLSRVDLMLETDGSVYVLEVNTNPGLHRPQPLPAGAKEAGIEFPDLCEKLIEMALFPATAQVSAPARSRRLPIPALEGRDGAAAPSRFRRPFGAVTCSADGAWRERKTTRQRQTRVTRR